MDESLRQYGNEEGMRQTPSRLLGRHWQEACKIGETTTDTEIRRVVAQPSRAGMNTRSREART
jgi:hypothetical protein